MNAEAALRCAVALVRQQQPSAAEYVEFLCWMRAAVRTVAAQHRALGKWWPFTTEEDIEEFASEYVTRLLNEHFRPTWRSLPDAEIQRLIMDDIFGGIRQDDHHHDGDFIEERKHLHVEQGVFDQEPAAEVNDEDEDIYEKDPAAMRRCVDGHGRTALARGRVTAAELATDASPEQAEEEATWLTLLRCLNEYCEAEWPEDWPRKRRSLAAHMLTWYERVKPEHDLDDYELADVIGLASAAEASRRLKEARTAYRPQPSAERTAVGPAENYLSSLRLRRVLRARRERLALA